jgi:hypothetical protein
MDTDISVQHRGARGGGGVYVGSVGKEGAGGKAVAVTISYTTRCARPINKERLRNATLAYDIPTKVGPRTRNRSVESNVNNRRP